MTIDLHRLSLNNRESLYNALLNLGQEHLFEGSGGPDHDDESKFLIDQLVEVDGTVPGGLVDYICRAKVLLEKCQLGENPFSDCEIQVPKHGVELSVGSPDYLSYEDAGTREIKYMCFCLVAGGLGERLGFPGIKVSLPIDTQTNICYMQWYAEYILEFERIAFEESGEQVTLPLAIMTSEDTHDRTIELLRTNHFFGLKENQVTLMKQQKVPSLKDVHAGLATCKSDRWKLETKPHGHGDCHSLLLQHGLAEKWASEGRKWLVFFQDTNALAFRVLVSSIGVSKTRNFLMNTIVVSRVIGEASGAICDVIRKNKSVVGERINSADEEEVRVTCCIEYNFLGPLLGSSENPKETDDGDGLGGKRRSPYPGNTNTLILSLPEYVRILKETRGVVPEFVNPKFSEDKRTFKSPTRLECLMQDFALLIKSKNRRKSEENDDFLEEKEGIAGYTMFPREACFSVVKNSTRDALGKISQGLPPDSPFSGEVEIFRSNEQLLRTACDMKGFKMVVGSNPTEISFLGLTQLVGPRISLLPSFGGTLREISKKICGDIFLGGSDVSLVLKSHDSSIGNICIKKGAVVVEEGGRAADLDEIDNDGWILQEVGESEGSVDIVQKIRGFIVVKKGERSFEG